MDYYVLFFAVFLDNMNSDTAKIVKERLCQLTTANVFRPGSNLYELKKLNIIRLNRMAPKVQIVIAEIVLHLLWRIANNDVFKEEPLYIFVDEAQNMPDGKDSMLATILSEGRKFGLNLIIATQLVLKGSTSALQQRLPQADTKLYFKPVTNRVSMTAKDIDPSNSSFWALKLRNLRVGEFVAYGSLIVGNKRMSKPIIVNGRDEEFIRRQQEFPDLELYNSDEQNDS